MTHTHTILAGNLRIRVGIGESGLALLGIADGKTGRKFFSGKRALFSLVTREILNPEKKETTDSLSGWEQVSAAKCGNVHLFTLQKPGLTVILTAEAKQNEVVWNVKLDSASKDKTLYECDYPVLPFASHRGVKVFFPYGCGELYKAEKPFTTRQNYPSYGASMQYMAVYHEKTGRGLYYGLHDPDPAYKKLEYGSDGKEGHLKAVMPLRDIDRAENGQTLAGELVWKLYDGDWYDAALFYKEFFLKKASWMPVMEDGKRADTPDELRENPFWWRKRMLWDEKYADELIRADKDLGLTKPSPVHLYDWFQIPYDTNYPHYFPAKDTFLTGTKRLQKYGIKVMPYINGRLWDTHDRGKEDWQFTPLAKPWCTKQAGGKPFLESYPTSNIDLAIMCPSSALWQEKMTEIVKTLFEEFGVDAVYMDQIGAAQAYPCEDKRHNHRAGGGSWWIESYRDLLGHIHRITPAGGFLTTECTSDPYMKEIQGYLSWIWIKNDQVPAFMVVYNGFVTVFGRCFDYAGEQKGKDMLIAQALTFGEQLGWIKPEVYFGLRHRDFFKKCVKCREQVGSYFYDGNLLRSPKIDDPCRLTTKKMLNEAYDGLLSHTATYSELWERKDGKKLLLLVNASPRKTRPVIASADLQDGVYRVCGDLTGDAEVKDGALSLELPPLSVSWVII